MSVISKTCLLINLTKCFNLHVHAAEIKVSGSDWDSHISFSTDRYVATLSLDVGTEVYFRDCVKFVLLIRLSHVGKTLTCNRGMKSSCSR